MLKLKKCIKCGKSDSEITSYYYTRTFGEPRIIHKTVGIYLPVCKSCAIKFDKYRKERLYKTNAATIFICLLVITGFWGFIWLTQPSSTYFAFIPFTLSMIFAIIAISLFISVFRSPDRISRYFKLMESGNLNVKTEGYSLESEIKEAIEEEIKFRSQESSYLKCPKCGTPQLITQDFCNSCGKDLRILRKFE